MSGGCGAVDKVQHKDGQSSGKSGGAAKRVGSFLIGLLLICALVWLAILPRRESTAALKKSTEHLNEPTVAIIAPKRAKPERELLLGGNMQALMASAIHARVNGYVKRRLVEIGTRVKAGQLLAEIDTPEIDQQLQQARADLATARSNYELAQRTADRWEELLKSNVVSRHGADQALSDRNAKKAALDSARFNLGRLEKTQSFKNIHAPFDGVITARNVDVGQLIDAGATGTGRELFHIATTDRLRVEVSVPQIYSRETQPGMVVELSLVEFPGKSFQGKLARTAQAIDPGSRTLLAEVEVENPTGELLPGAYAQVRLKLKAEKPALLLPINALLFRTEGVQVGVVGADRKVVLKKVTLGRDLGTEVEVVSGLDAADQVILNPADSLVSGTLVKAVKQAEQKKPAG